MSEGSTVGKALVNEIETAAALEMEVADMVDTQLTVQWSEFVSFIADNARPEWLPESYSITEEALDQIRERLEKGMSDQLVAKHYNDFIRYIDLSADASMGETSDLFGMEESEFFNHEIDTTPSAVNQLGELVGSGYADEIPEDPLSDLAAYGDSLGSAGSDFSLAPNSFDEIRIPTDDELISDDIPTVINTETEAAEEIDEVSNELFDQENNSSKQDLDSQNAIHQAGMYPAAGNLVPEQPSVGRSLYRMAQGIAAGGANLVMAAAGPTVKMGTWGAEQLSRVSQSVGDQNQKIDNRLEAVSNQSIEEGNQQRHEFRADNLSARTRNISDLMEQVREQTAFLNEPAAPGVEVTVSEAVEESKNTESKSASLFKHTVKEFLTDYGVDQLKDRLTSIQYGHNLINEYLDQSKMFADKMGISGEELEGIIGEAVSKYSTEVEEATSVLGDLLAIAKETGVMNDEDDAESQEKLSKLNDAVAKIMEKLKTLFAKPAISPGM